MSGSSGLSYIGCMTFAKPLCGKGHPMDGENLVIDKQGKSACRTCKRLRNREYMRRTAASWNEKGRVKRAAERAERPPKPLPKPRVYVRGPYGKPVERFWSRVEKTDGCWEYTGARTARGYGRLGVEGHSVLAHRYSWELTHGTKLSPDVLVCHHCDNPCCVRPDHLFLGSSADNNRDMAAKGRHGQSRRTHCPAGHPYSLENTRVSAGRRQCRECARENVRARYRTMQRLALETGVPITELLGRSRRPRLVATVAAAS
jgi:hypothetical protein